MDCWEDHQFLSSISANFTERVKKSATQRLWFLSLKVLNTSLNFQLELFIEQSIYYLIFFDSLKFTLRLSVMCVEVLPFPAQFVAISLLGVLIQEGTNVEHLHAGTREPQGQSD